MHYGAQLIVNNRYGNEIEARLGQGETLSGVGGRRFQTASGEIVEDFVSHFGQGLERADDVVELSRAPDEVNQVNSVRGLHLLGRSCVPTESGIHQVQAAPGFVWKPVTSIVDSGAINNVAPCIVWAKAVMESNGFQNCMTYHTADGTHIPNHDGSTQLSQTFPVANIARPLTSVRGLADAGNLVVSGREGGFIANSDTERRLNFSDRARRCTHPPREPASSQVFSREGREHFNVSPVWKCGVLNGQSLQAR